MTLDDIIYCQKMTEQLKMILDEIEHECHSLKVFGNECVDLCQESIDAETYCLELFKNIYEIEHNICDIKKLNSFLQQELEYKIPLAKPPHI